MSDGDICGVEAHAEDGAAEVEQAEVEQAQEAEGRVRHLHYHPAQAGMTRPL